MWIPHAEDVEARRTGRPIAAGRAVVPAIAAAVAWGLCAALPRMSALVLAAAVAALALPIWRHLWTSALLRRRLMLAGTLRSDSWVRPFFWRGHIAGAALTVVAATWAVLMLAGGRLAGEWTWTIVLLDGLALGLAATLARPLIARHVVPEHVDGVLRRWPLAWLNAALLAVALCAVEFFTGAPDTRHLAWDQVARAAYERESAPLQVDAMGRVVGALAALEALGWHAAQIGVPQVPERGLRILAWLAVLLQFGVFAMAATHLQLGVLALLERQAGRPARGLRTDRSWPFAAGLAGLAVLALMAEPVIQAAGGSLSHARQHMVDPCAADRAALSALQKHLDGAIAQRLNNEGAAVGASIDSAMQEVSKHAEARMDAYLDDYFSVLGDYQRIASAVRGKGEEYLAERFRNEVQADVEQAIEQAGMRVAAESEARWVAAAHSLGQDLVAWRGNVPCRFKAVNTAALGGIEGPVLRAAVATAGVPVAATAARKALAVAGTRAAQPVFRRAAALLGKVIARRAGVVTVAGSVGAFVCKPLGPLCARVLAVLASVGVDTLMVEINEKLFRDEMRHEILDALQLDAVSAALKAEHLQRAALMAEMVHRAADRTFIPARDGV